MARTRGMVGHLPVDGRKVSIQVASNALFQRGGDVSPITLSTAARRIGVPKGAIRMIVNPTDYIFWNYTGTFDATDGNGYGRLEGLQPFPIPCATQPFVFVRAGAGTPTLYFWFEVCKD